MCHDDFLEANLNRLGATNQKSYLIIRNSAKEFDNLAEILLP